MGLMIMLFTVVLAFCLYLKIRKDLSNVWHGFFGNKSIKEVIANREIQAQETPKTLFGMETISLPYLEKDFPDLNINEIKSMAEDFIIKFLGALENKNGNNLEFNSEKVNSYIVSKINDLGSDTVNFNNIKIHKTILNRYEKKDGIATLKLQTALEYDYRKNDDQYKKVQDRFITEFIFIIDESQVSESAKALGLNCPNCGAPIKNIGEKYCDYCGSGIKDIVKRVWILNNFSQF